jgi:hypothetical protein
MLAVIPVKLSILLLLVAGLVALRFVRAGMLAWAVAWWVATYVLLEFGFRTPVPHSVVQLYMAIVTASLFAYVSSDRERLHSFLGPIRKLVLEPRYKPALLAVLLLVPALAAFNVYRGMRVPIEAPAFGRTVHPAPPDTITVHEQEIDLVRGGNPYRELEHTDPAAYRAHLENGRRVYFENCFFCHGDFMAGDGVFAHGLNPIPTNFRDAGNIPQLEETFLFWRIAKGGPGLPEEAGPWDSAMPAWESFLTVEEMWDAVLFLYDYTGYRPRAKEHHE